MNRARLIKNLSFLMALCLILSLLPSIAFASSENRPLYFSDGQLRYDGQQGNIATDLPGWSASGSTLTLNGFSYTTSARYGLVIYGNVTLVLSGTNTLVCTNPTATGSSGGLRTAFIAYDNLIIKGTGALDITSQNSFTTNIGIFADSLKLSDSATVTVLTTGSTKSSDSAVLASNALSIYDSATLSATNACGGFGISTSTLAVYGGEIRAISENSKYSSGYGLRVSNAFSGMQGGSIYAKGQGNAVDITGASPAGISVKGNDGSSSADPYTVDGALINYYASGASGTTYRAVVLDANGSPDPLASITDAKISLAAEPESYTLTVNYLDEDGKSVGSQKITVPSDSDVSHSDFVIPSGYEFKGSYGTTVTEDKTISVTVYKIDDESDFIASDWAQEELKRADELGLIPDSLRDQDLTKPITRAEFAAVSVKAYEALAGVAALPSVINPFTDTRDVEVLKAYNVGITNGTSETTFSPDLFLNREQAATMLTRVFKRVTMPGWTLPDDGKFPLSYKKPTAFADDASISDWAKNSVYFMAANNIVEGLGNNKFAPKNITTEQEAIGYANTTREQAIIIALRMTENL